jgi:hypothetical protein
LAALHFGNRVRGKRMSQLPDFIRAAEVWELPTEREASRVANTLSHDPEVARMITEFGAAHKATAAAIESVIRAPFDLSILEPKVLPAAVISFPDLWEPKSVDEVAERRAGRQWIEERLKVRSLTVYRWEKIAGVGDNVGANYLNGKTKRLSRDSRKRLAEAIGLKANELPD